MSIATVVTRGYGSFGSIREVVTRGYGDFAAVISPGASSGGAHGGGRRRGGGSEWADHLDKASRYSRKKQKQQLATLERAIREAADEVIDGIKRAEPPPAEVAKLATPIQQSVADVSRLIKAFEKDALADQLDLLQRQLIQSQNWLAEYERQRAAFLAEEDDIAVLLLAD